MTTEQANMLNKLMDVERELGTLWDYHEDNPDRINVEERFLELQREALSIESYLQENGVDVEEEKLPF